MVCKARVNLASIGQAELNLNLRAGASLGRVNCLDLGIVGAEVGANGIRFSTCFGGIRLFGKGTV